MSRLFKTLTGIASAVAAGVVAKLCYDVYQEKRNRDILDQEFFDDIEDDFEGFDDDFSGEEIAVSKKEEAATSLTCQDVIDCVSDVLEVSSEDILSKSRKADVANARRIAIFVCANELKVSNATICDEFGGIGSTSVTNAKKSVADKIKEDDIFASDVEDVIAALKSLENSFSR